MRSKDSNRSSRPPPRERAIVVVESDTTVGEFIRGSLGASDYEVVHAATLESALRIVEATTLVVAIVDDDLPLVRGLDLVGRLRSERPDIESILITRDEAFLSFAARIHVERLQCLRKPLYLEDLRNCVVRAEERLDRTARRSPRSTKDAEPVSFRDAARPRSDAPSSQANPPSGDRLNVLVVDDDPLVRRSMARTFSRHRVTMAENGRKAAQEIEKNRPDIIISDLKMPEMDGFQLAEQIKERWPELSNRILFVSGTSSQIERAKTETPARPLLTKPVSNQELEARMAEVLEAATRRR